jgi:C-terminal processing protease CtpA/Prc
MHRPAWLPAAFSALGSFAIAFAVRGETPPAPSAPDLPRALTPRGLDNEIAFARLFGYVRFFHPSDEAAHTDWNDTATAGARDVEAAKTADECAATLQSLFAPIAPTLRVFATPKTGIPGIPFAPGPAGLSPPLAATGLFVTMWVHHGYGAGLLPNNVYSSARETTPWVGASPPPFADPRAPMLVDLYGGVSALLPIALFADANGTLPHGAPLPASGPPVSGPDDRTVRLGSVAFAWTVFQHFYPYFDVVRVDWDAALVKALRKAAIDRERAEFRDTLAQLVAALHDGHGQVSDPMTRDLTALPITWGIVERQLVVLGVADDVTGVRRGDVVVSIDGVPARDALTRAEALESAATPQYLQWKGLLTLARGHPGKAVRLTLVSRGLAPRTLGMTYPEVSGYEWATERRPNTIASLRPGIWYVDLNRLTDAEFQNAVPTLAGASGIVFDLRGYPSRIGPQWMTHLSDHELESALWKVPIVTRPDGHDWRFPAESRWHLQPTAPRFTAKMAFLIDARTVSYAESTAGILEAYRLGALVGEPTAGTNGNIDPFQTPAGFKLSWTGMRVIRHDGAVHHGHGIQPTLIVHKTIAGIAEGRDEQLEAAVRAVR